MGKDIKLLLGIAILAVLIYFTNSKSVEIQPNLSSNQIEQTEFSNNTDLPNATEFPKEIRYKMGDNFAESNSRITSSSDNYFLNALNSNGKITIWEKMPISVYISPCAYSQTIEAAFVEYNRVFNGIINFKRTNKKNSANIQVEVTDKLENVKSSEIYIAGITNCFFKTTDNSIDQAVIKLLSKQPNSTEPITQEKMYFVIMHEIGHALGIIGHSENKYDLMYAFSDKNKGVLTKRDIATINLMYSGDKKLIESSSEGAAEIKLREALKYAEQVKNKPIAWINLANIYYDLNRKEDALNAFKKALMLDGTNPSIYQGMAQCYYSSKKYDTAIKYYGYALQYNKDSVNENIYKHMIGVCYAHQNKYNEGYPYLKESYEKTPDSSFYLNNLLIVCTKLNRISEAKNYVTNYLSRHPEESSNENFKIIMELK